MKTEKTKSNSERLAELDEELNRAKAKITELKNKRKAIAKRIELERREAETAKALLFYEKYSKFEERLRSAEQQSKG